MILKEWSPAHNSKSLRRRQSSKEDCLLDAVTTPPLDRLESSDRIAAKEYFVFSDNVSQLYHFTVEGHQLKDGVRIPPEVILLIATLKQFYFFLFRVELGQSQQLLLKQSR